jgi:hypothetical protein
MDMHIWYCPTTSAPSALERYILKIKDSPLVNTENTVTVATALTTFLLFAILQYIQLINRLFKVIMATL